MIITASVDSATTLVVNLAQVHLTPARKFWLDALIEEIGQVVADEGDDVIITTKREPRTALKHFAALCAFAGIRVTDVTPEVVS